MSMSSVVINWLFGDLCGSIKQVRSGSEAPSTSSTDFPSAKRARAS